MPAKTDRRHRQGQESRERILEAALAIAAERGYDGTTIALITEATGLPASSVYWQFRNKDELLAEALDYSYRQWRRDGPTWQPANYSGNPRERVATRLRYSRLSIERQPEYWRLGLMVTLLHKTGKISAQERFLLVRGETQLIITEWWRSVLPPEADAYPVLAVQLTRDYIALVDGMFVAHRADPGIDLPRLTQALAPAIADVAQAWAADPKATVARFGPAHRAPARQARIPAASEDSRVRLLEATADIAAERGYRGTTISRICARAELPVSSVYWFFTDKDELLAEVVQHSWDEWLASQPAWLPPADGQTWGDALRAILRLSAQSLLDAPSFMRIGHMLTLEHQSTEVAARERFIGIRVGIEGQITAWFAENLPARSVRAQPELPQILAQAVIAFTDGFFLGSQIDSAEHSVAGFVDFVVDVLEAASMGSGRRGRTARGA